jgi:hypothetical protein
MRYGVRLPCSFVTGRAYSFRKGNKRPRKREKYTLNVVYDTAFVLTSDRSSRTLFISKKKPKDRKKELTVRRSLAMFVCEDRCLYIAKRAHTTRGKGKKVRWNVVYETARAAFVDLPIVR